jgi:NTE family protein
MVHSIRLYASRTTSHVLRQKQLHRLRHVIAELARRLPEAEQKTQTVNELAAYGCLTRMHVVRLLAPPLDGEDHTKDIDFSPNGIHERWEVGYADTSRVLELAPGPASSILWKVSSSMRHAPGR